MGLGSWFGKIKEALTKTQQVVASRIRSILGAFRKLDEETLRQIEEALLGADFGPETALRVTDDLRKAYREGKIREASEALGFLKATLQSILGQADRTINLAPAPPTVILVVGVNGSGKTTSIAKLAKKFRDEGKKVLIAAADTFRAAAVDQLAIWAERVGAEIVRHGTGADPAAVCFDALDAAVARGVDVVLVDTAGRLQTKEHLMRELEKIRRVIRKKIPSAPHEVLLVLDATVGQNGMSQAEHFREAAGVTGIFLAKLDGTARGGIVFGIQQRMGIPVKFVGVGEKAEDLAPFDPHDFVEGLFAE